MCYHEEVATGRRGKGCFRWGHCTDQGPEAGKSLACCRERDPCGGRVGERDRVVGEFGGIAEARPSGGCCSEYFRISFNPGGEHPEFVLP